MTFLSTISFLLVCGAAISMADPVKIYTLDDVSDDSQALKKQLFDVQDQLAALKKSLKSIPSTNPTSACTIQNTPVQHHTSGVTYEKLDAHDIRCPEGKVLTRFQLKSDSIGTTGEANVYYEYICCSLV